MDSVKDAPTGWGGGFPQVPSSSTESSGPRWPSARNLPRGRWRGWWRRADRLLGAAGRRPRCGFTVVGPYGQKGVELVTSVLVVEDEPQLVRALEINLRARQYEVAAAPDGATALRLAIDGSPDIVLMDLGLPDIDGIEVIKRLRGRSRVPIVVVSARRTSEEKVEALDAGADDYLTKPFGMAELVARLRAAARRVEPAAPADDIYLVATENFTVDLLSKRVRRRGSDVRLTATEWQLLEVLVRRRGRPVGQHELLAEIWGDSFETRNNHLRVHLACLRRKLEGDPARPRHFITLPGGGYRFEVRD